MDTRHQSCKLVYLVVVILLWTVTGCTPVSPESLPEQTSVPPTVIFKSAPNLLCRSATQIRLNPQITGVWPLDSPGLWTLTTADNETVLNQGEFSPEKTQLFAAFPDGKALDPGTYVLTLRLGDTSLAQHTFAINADSPTIGDLVITILPTGPDVTRLEANTSHFYMRYPYQGACPGAPYWITVKHKDETICTVNDTLDAADGIETVPCYREDGAALENGTYHVELSLMGEVHHNITFEVGDAPPPPTLTPAATLTPQPTPTSSPIVCEPLFAAAGLNTDGEPFLPLDYFDWYSQIIFVGSACKNLDRPTPWSTIWYRDGERVREFDGAWNGESLGVVWDSITGIPEAPFLLPGTYTVTMTIAGTTPLTTAFRILYYPTPTPTP